MSPVFKNVIKISISLLFAACSLELLCRLFFTSFKDRFTFYEPDRYILKDSELAKAKRVYDFRLGWKHPYSTTYGERPRAVDYDRPFISVFGDSFTHCDQVRDRETFEEYLSKRLKKDVYNFGVGGYGTDQAYLRFKEDYPKVKTPIAALGVISENINRVVNVYRPFYYPKTKGLLPKPRFVLRGGSLKLIENPIHSASDIIRLKDPDFVRSLGRNDYWFNRGGYPELRFSYTLILFNRKLWQEALYRQRGGVIDDINPRPWDDVWGDKSIRKLYFSIIEAFIRDAKSADALPLILLLPRKREVVRALEGKPLGGADYILGYCQKNHYLCFNGINVLTKRIKKTKKNISEFYIGHLSPLGNKTIAAGLYRFLKNNDLIPEPEAKTTK